MLFFATLVPSAVLEETPQPGIPLKLLAGKPVVDTVFINGQGPYRFLLDTGSQSNQIDAELARKLGIADTLRLDLETPSGESTVHGGHVSELSLGPAQATEQEFLFTRFADLYPLPPDIRGILGQEFLSHFDYLLDFEHHRLIFGVSSAVGMPTTFRLIFGRMAVSTSLGDLVLDSGAEMLFLFRPFLHPAVAQVVGASGVGVPVSIETAPEVRIGNRRYYASRAEFRPVPAAEEAGLLPANLFHAIFICNSKRYVVFNPLR
ncbi:MAG TPA: retropepsin-like aspartic protease [Candidatus Aquilonibacter sp.]|nr:retropepsin-like aspartic protease [Candidatus Aquilonibacter sp.]